MFCITVLEFATELTNGWLVWFRWLRRRRAYFHTISSSIISSWVCNGVLFVYIIDIYEKQYNYSRSSHWTWLSVL